MATAIVLFTRDLRVHDNPALHAAVTSADRVVPLFVVDDRITSLDFSRPNRARFLAESLADLDRALRNREAHLVVRRGDAVTETARLADQVGADIVHVAADYSRFAAGRERRLHDALGRRVLHTHHSHVAVPPGDLTPAGSDHFAVFSAYHRRWLAHPLRDPSPAPDKIVLPEDLDPGRLPSQHEIQPGDTSPGLMPGGETAARTRARDWYDGLVADYGGDGSDGHNDLGGEEGTSRLSPYLHFGCISPVELIARADRRRRGADEFVRQLAWRDFYHQVLAARPEVVDIDYRPRGDHWRRDPDGLQAWKDGRTGYPLVDAGMRQLAGEGWMHNRARLVTAGFLTKHLYVDWREGARHFFDLLVDGDIANNTMNWQWVAGTGTDTRPNRMLNPTLQAERYDPAGVYVKRWVEELGTPDYPPPVVEHREAVRAFREARSGPTTRA